MRHGTALAYSPSDRRTTGFAGIASERGMKESHFLKAGHRRRCPQRSSISDARAPIFAAMTFFED
jgi:hypothetical protein